MSQDQKSLISFLPMVLVVALLFPQTLLAQLSEEPISLESITIDTEDTNTILRGGQFFAQNCMLCHTMIHLKNDQLAQKAGVLYAKMPINRHDWWFGVEPPDLSLIARVRSADWLYTYLHSFYKDPSRKQQNNNLLRDQTNMPNPFGGMQGEQVLTVTQAHLQNMSGVFAGKPRYFDVLELDRQGTMSSEEFDHHIFDVVSFLVYASDPDSGVRRGYAPYVLLFLGLFIVLTFLLKREYWRTLK